MAQGSHGGEYEMPESYLELLRYCMNEGILVCIVAESENVSAYDASVMEVDNDRILLSQFEGKRELSIPTKKITSVGILIHR